MLSKEEIQERIAEAKSPEGGYVMPLTSDLTSVWWFEFISGCLRENFGNDVYVICNMETEFRLKRLMIGKEWDTVLSRIKFEVNNNFERKFSLIPSREGVCQVEALVFNDQYQSMVRGYIFEAQ